MGNQPPYGRNGVRVTRSLFFDLRPVCIPQGNPATCFVSFREHVLERKGEAKPTPHGKYPGSRMNTQWVTGNRAYPV